MGNLTVGKIFNMSSGANIKSTPEIRVRLTVDKADGKLLSDNLRVVATITKLRAARTLMAIGADLLANAQPRVPFDTGQLRESGKVVMKAGRGSNIVIASGNKDGTINANLAAYKAKDLKNVKTITVNVSYTRFNSAGEDIATWTHEILRPYSERKEQVSSSRNKIFYARQPNTGPKYLLLPYLEKKDKYSRLMLDIANNRQLSKDIALVSKIVKSRVGRYTVNRVKLVESQIDRIGYFGKTNL